ncbi:MAG: rhodanese-like domain-containing protein [Acidimicrobiia bacterium]|nr:rhodanese-like domain-containing protein [Acidimicrobiia bacterium]
MHRPVGRLFALLAIATLVGAGCSASAATIERVQPGAAAEIVEADADVVVLDIRTPEEFGQGAIEGATNIDFYAPDFADQLDHLDRDVHYVVYCRSGNRSGQSMSIFADLGFADVTEIDGGVVSWLEEGLPIVLP